MIVLWALLALSSSGFWSEPILDLALTVYAAGFVLMIAHAAASDRSLSAVPLRWRVLDAAAASLFAIVIVVLTPIGAFRAGILAFVLSVVAAVLRPRGGFVRPKPPARRAYTDPSIAATEVALAGLPTAVRVDDSSDEPPEEALHRVRSHLQGTLTRSLRGIQVTKEDGITLRLLLIDGPAETDTDLDPELLVQTWIGLSYLDESVVGPNRSPKGPGAPLLRLIYALDDPQMGTLPQKIESPVLQDFLIFWPPLESSLNREQIDPDERLRQFNVLVRSTAQEACNRNEDREVQGSGDKRPTILETLIAECVARELPGKERWRGEAWEDWRLRRRLYLRAAANWADPLPGRDDPRPEDGSRRLRQRRRSNYRYRVQLAPEMIVAAWTAHLRQALSARGIDPNRSDDDLPSPGFSL